MGKTEEVEGKVKLYCIAYTKSKVTPFIIQISNLEIYSPVHSQLSCKLEKLEK